MRAHPIFGMNWLRPFIFTKEESNLEGSYDGVALALSSIYY